MEIKVGEYVRTKRGIAKVLEVKTVQPKMYGQHDVAYKIDKCPRMYISETAFIKHSPNIIDLIEVGDYVNGRLVLAVDYKRQNICLLIPLTDTKANTNIMWYGYEEIKTILTHELYKANAYKVKGE